jgi:dihydrofolate synthase/folylpolyglutamate synthase
VSREAIERGLLDVRLPGRFQFFPGPVPVLLDVAHNPQAVRNLVTHLRRYYPYRRCKAVFSVMRDKDIPAMIGILREHMQEWYLAPLRMPRAASPEELKKILHNAGITRVRNGYTDAADAIQAASRDALSGDLLVIFGSFFLVSEYLATVADEDD